jgi:hypothetical protein
VKNKPQRVTPVQAAKWLAKAWNCSSQNKPLKYLKMAEGEKFPQVVGCDWQTEPLKVVTNEADTKVKKTA